MQEAGHALDGPNGSRLPGEHQPDGLEGVLGLVAVAEDSPADAQHEPAVTPDEAGEGVLVAVAEEAGEQLSITSGRWGRRGREAVDVMQQSLGGAGHWVVLGDWEQNLLPVIVRRPARCTRFPRRFLLRPDRMGDRTGHTEQYEEDAMPIVSIVCGGLLMALGGYLYADTGALTSLIPAGIGALLAGLGALALKESLLKHAMHAAAMIGLLSFLATAFMGLPKLVTMLTGGEVERPKAVIGQSITAGICLVFVALCVNSFIQARRRRAAAKLGGPQ
jgi:hypothetical protein